MLAYLKQCSHLRNRTETITMAVVDEDFEEQPAMLLVTSGWFMSSMFGQCVLIHNDN